MASVRVDSILADPDPGLRKDFAESTKADPGQRARLLDDPSPAAVVVPAMGPMPYRGLPHPARRTDGDLRDATICNQSSS
ncbi:hypothetical protein [Streptomyces sp. NPDC003710]